MTKRTFMCRCVTPFPKFLYKSLFVILPVCLILNHVTICNTRTYKSLKVISSHTTSKELKQSFVFNFQCLFVGSVSIHTTVDPLTTLTKAPTCCVHNAKV